MIEFFYSIGFAFVKWIEMASRFTRMLIRFGVYSSSSRFIFFSTISSHSLTIFPFGKISITFKEQIKLECPEIRYTMCIPQMQSLSTISRNIHCEIVIPENLIRFNVSFTYLLSVFNRLFVMRNS